MEKRLGFAGSPFISTTRFAKHAVRYARGLKGTDEKLRRTKGDVVGKVFIYIFKIVDLAKQAAVDPNRLAKDKKIGMDLLKSKEGEITFMGAVPAENLEETGSSTPRRTSRVRRKEIEDIALVKAYPHGGFERWDK